MLKTKQNKTKLYLSETFKEHFRFLWTMLKYCIVENFLKAYIKGFFCLVIR